MWSVIRGGAGELNFLVGEYPTEGEIETFRLPGGVPHPKLHP